MFALIKAAIAWRLHAGPAELANRNVRESIRELITLAWRMASTLEKRPDLEHAKKLLLIHHRNWWVCEFLDEIMRYDSQLYAELSLPVNLLRIALKHVDQVSERMREDLEEALVSSAAALAAGMMNDHNATEKWWLDALRPIE